MPLISKFSKGFRFLLSVIYWNLCWNILDVAIREYKKKKKKNYSADPLYLIFRYVNGCFEGINGNKHLTLVPTNGSKEKNMKKCELKSEFN